MFLGFRLRMLRRQYALSQKELGKMIGVSKVSISGYEKGYRVPSMEVLNRILTVLNVSADYILGRELGIVCEGSNEDALMSKSDVEIIREIRSKPVLYNQIAENPKRFFSVFDKKNI